MRHQDVSEGVPIEGRLCSPVRSAPDDLQDALRHHNAGHLEKADRIYRDLLRQNPNNGEILRLLGLLARQRGDHLAADKWMRSAVVARPLDAGCWQDFGRILHAQGRFRDAVDCYRNSLAIKPRAPRTWSNLAQALCSLGAFSQAAAAYHECLVLTPRDLVALCDLAAALKNLGLYEEAVRALYRALEIDPDFEAARTALSAVRVEAQWRRSWAIWQRRRTAAESTALSGEVLLIGRACQVREVLSSTQCENLVRHIMQKPAAANRSGAKLPRVSEAPVWPVELNTHTSVIYDRLIELLLTTNHVHYGLKINTLDVFLLAECDSSKRLTGEWYPDRGGTEDVGETTKGKKSLFVAVQLSDPETYVGGTLEFRIGGTIARAGRMQGAAVMFPASALHRVSPVTRGRQFSLLCRCAGEKE